MSVLREVEGFDVAAAAEAWPGCPERFLHALARYVDARIETGAFLRACLENDLCTAVPLADEESFDALPSIVGVLNNLMPAKAWGSKEAVAQWLRKSRKEVAGA